jgi:hypothetical protein
VSVNNIGGTRDRSVKIHSHQFFRFRRGHHCGGFSVMKYVCRPQPESPMG